MAASKSPGDPEEVPAFIGQLFHWCYRWGCEVRLLNKAWDYPRYTSVHMVSDTFERQADGSLADLDQDRSRSVIPEIEFTRGDRHLRICAGNWSDLIRRFRHEYRRIFMELSVPYCDFFEGKAP